MIDKNSWKQNRLKEIRKQFGFTQKEVAEKLGLECEDRLSHWERGQAMPGVKNLFKLAQIYAVSIEDFYKTK